MAVTSTNKWSCCKFSFRPVLLHQHKALFTLPSGFGPVVLQKGKHPPNLLDVELCTAWEAHHSRTSNICRNRRHLDSVVTLALHSANLRGVHARPLR